MTDADLGATHQADRSRAAVDVPPLAGALTLGEAIARALKFNLERRARQMEEVIAGHALAAIQLDMLPRLVAQAGDHNRDSDLIVRSRDSVTGAPSLANPSISSDRSQTASSLVFSWSLLEATNQELGAARIELLQLVNLPLAVDLKVSERGAAPGRAMLDLPIDRLELLASTRNADHREQADNLRIANDEAKKAMTRLFPGLGLDVGARYDTDSDLIHQRWNDAGLRLSFSLMNLFSAPVQQRLADAGIATLRDDGAGAVFDDSGRPVDGTNADDDRPRPAAETPAAAAPAAAPVPVQVTAPAVPQAGPTWLPPVIDPVSPVSGGEVHTLTVGERTPDQLFGLNTNVRFALPIGLFNASRPTEQLTLSAELADGRALPAWLSFNPSTRSFDGKPPAGAKGELVIKVSARDGVGNQAVAMFRLQIGETEDPNAATATAPAPANLAVAPAADPRQPVRKTERAGRVSLQQQLKDPAPPRRTVAELPRAPATPKG